MTLATLSEVLQPALKSGYAVAGLVTLGWEDMRAYVAAAEAEGVPVILQAGPSCRAHTPLPILGKMFRHLAGHASVRVVAHLDHGYTYDECKEALDAGFTSLMFDGSRKPLHQNIDETAAIAEMAHAAGISCEGEVGFVGYAGAKLLLEPTRTRQHNLPAKLGSMPWRSRLAMCICNKIGTAGWTSGASEPSKPSRGCHWSFMVVQACRWRNVGHWRLARISASSTLAPNCAQHSARLCAQPSTTIQRVLTGCPF